MKSHLLILTSLLLVSSVTLAYPSEIKKNSNKETTWSRSGVLLPSIECGFGVNFSNSHTAYHFNVTTALVIETEITGKLKKSRLDNEEFSSGADFHFYLPQIGYLRINSSQQNYSYRLSSFGAKATICPNELELFFNLGCSYLLGKNDVGTRKMGIQTTAGVLLFNEIMGINFSYINIGNQNSFSLYCSFDFGRMFFTQGGAM